MEECGGIIDKMPYPFAVFSYTDKWHLASANDAFCKLFGCRTGTPASVFGIPMSTGREEIEIDGRWYAVYSCLMGRNVVVIMHDITNMKQLDGFVMDIMNNVAGLI